MNALKFSGVADDAELLENEPCRSFNLPKI